MHLVQHLHVLLRAAEALEQVAHAEGFLLTGGDPAVILAGAGDPVQENAEGFPHRRLAN